MNQTNNVFLLFKSIHHYVDDIANSHPDKTCISYNHSVMTYHEVNILANQLAHFLVEKMHVQIGDLVGVSVNRSLFMVICLLAILKAGAAYVPIDPNYPHDRIDYMLKDSGVQILMTEHSIGEKMLFQGKQLFIDDREQFCSMPTFNPNIAISSNSLAYVLYTSGSTGDPKGVMVSHGSLIHALNGWKNIYQLSSEDCHLQMANFSFDVFTGDLIRALCTGAKLVLCPRDSLLRPTDLYRLMLEEKITCAEFIPTIVRRLMEYAEHTDKSLDFMRLMICGSDNWSINEYTRLQKLCGPKTRVISSYGLTEATIDSTYFENKEAILNFAPSNSVPIGKPFPNTKIEILNDRLERLPRGEVGEIYIGGHGLAIGYINRPDLTEKKFIIDPYHTSLNERLYRTGDLGRYLPDGNIELLGRIDNQVKLRGMRIELSDIENALTSHPHVRESLIILAKDESDHERLIAYTVFEEGFMPQISELRQYLKNKLPSYMVPSLFIHVEALPITPNGKLDRKILSQVSGRNFDSLSAYSPRDPVERELTIIWQNVLKTSQAGIFDHFDESGGDSLLCASLVKAIEDRFFIQVPICKLEKNFTIEALSNLVKQLLQWPALDLNKEKDGLKNKVSV